jgi:hypothetical protein
VTGGLSRQRLITNAATLATSSQNCHVAITPHVDSDPAC